MLTPKQKYLRRCERRDDACLDRASRLLTDDGVLRRLRDYVRKLQRKLFDESPAKAAFPALYDVRGNRVLTTVEQIRQQKPRRFPPNHAIDGVIWLGCVARLLTKKNKEKP